MSKRHTIILVVAFAIGLLFIYLGSIDQEKREFKAILKNLGLDSIEQIDNFSLWRESFVSNRESATIEILNKNGINTTKEDIEGGLNQLYRRIKDGENSGPEYYLTLSPSLPAVKCYEWLEEDCNNLSLTYGIFPETCKNINNSCIVQTAIDRYLGPAFAFSVTELVKGFTTYKDGDKSISNNVGDTLLSSFVFATKGIQAASLTTFLQREINNCVNITSSSETEIRTCIKNAFDKFSNLSKSVYLSTNYRESKEFPYCAYSIVPNKIEHFRLELWRKMNSTEHPVLLYMRSLDYYATTKCIDALVDNITSARCISPSEFNKSISVGFVMASAGSIASCWTSTITQQVKSQLG